MKKLKDFLSEAKSEEKTYKVGKSKVVITKEKGKFIATVDGQKLDAFKTMKAAEKGVQDFFQFVSGY